MKVKVKTKKKKLKSLKLLRKKAWKVFSEWIRKRDKGVCISCGKRGNWRTMNAGHFIHKNSMDFSEWNVNCQCVACNKYKHGNLGVYAYNLTQKYGLGIIESLIEKGKEVKKYSREEIEDIILKYGGANP